MIRFKVYDNLYPGKWFEFDATDSMDAQEQYIYLREAAGDRHGDLKIRRA